MKRPRASVSVDVLIFDLDGTILETQHDIATAVNLTLKGLGLPARDPKEIHGFIGEGVRRLLLRSLPDPSEEKFQEAMGVFRGHYLAHLLDTTRFYPGVEDVLRLFKSEGKKLAIVTNKPEVYTTPIVDGLKIRGIVDLVVASDTIMPLKPDPAMLLRVLDVFTADKERSVMVGDGLPDIQAARAAGLQVCAVGYGLGKREDLLAARPDFFCEKAEELREIFC